VNENSGRGHSGLPPVPTEWVPGRGPDKCDCMIVGEAPGRQEWTAKRPFFKDAPAGGLLRSELEAAGLTAVIEECIYITNVVKVFPPIDDGRTSKKLKPTEAQIAAAMWFLEAEIRYYRPKHVLALGATAIKTLTGSCRTIKHAREHPRDLVSHFGHSARVIPTYHPSYICCRPGGEDKLRDFQEDLRQFIRACI